MLHLKNEGYTPKDSTNLLKKARDLSTGINVTIRDCRVSRKHIEYDVSIDQSKLNPLVEKLTTIGALDHVKHVVDEKIEKKEAIKKGISYFNNERFWECHEVLEGVWKKCYEEEKDLLQGLILVAAALVHFQKAENEICLSVLGRGLKKLANASGKYYDIDIDKLRNKVIEIRNSGKISTFEI